MIRHLTVGLIASLALAGCRHDDNRAVLDNAPGYRCEAPSRTVYRPWGENGESKSCIGVDGQLAGTFITAEWGRVFSVENFDGLRRHREGQIFDKHGRVIRRTLDGKPVKGE